jgi:hypothetical protein
MEIGMDNFRLIYRKKKLCLDGGIEELIQAHERPVEFVPGAYLISEQEVRQGTSRYRQKETADFLTHYTIHIICSYLCITV